MNKETIHLIKGYLGYDVECECITYDTYKYNEILENGLFGSDSHNYEYIKPILRPIEDLNTLELMKLCSCLNIIYVSIEAIINHIKELIDFEILSTIQAEYMYSKGIDFKNLIGQGLAIRKEVK